MRKTVKRLRLHVSRASASQGVLIAGNLRLRCAIGRSGITALKREGDGATPRGKWRLVRLLRRQDRMRFLPSALPAKFIRPSDGWCEVPADRNYNCQVTLPYPVSHESLWRDDHLYDAIVVLDHNQRPRRRFGGSAIFLHLKSPEGRPTQGCVAVSRASMRKLMALCGPRTWLVIG